MAEYYVSPFGNDTTGTGTITLPWRTIAKAHTATLAGDTIWMRGGRKARNAENARRSAELNKHTGFLEPRRGGLL